jgi:ribosomal protein S18 acetylase RimI-like enzyme
MSDPRCKLRPFAVGDAARVGPWLDGPGVSLPPGDLAGRWAQRLIGDPRIAAFVAVCGGIPVGFGRLDIGPDRVAELTLAVDPALRRQGHGGRLLEMLLAEANRRSVRRLQAIVDLSNQPALSLFAAQGFEEAAVDGQAVCFVRRLHEAGKQALELDC